jgi:hypothetical protein
MLRGVTADSGATTDDQLHVAVQDAVAAFSGARSAFDELERSHLPGDYAVLAERLRTLGDALSEVHRLAIARRQGPGPEPRSQE